MIVINKHQQLEELYTDWDELEAYICLDGKPFDFGSGEITCDDSRSECAYWKIKQCAIDKYIGALENDCCYTSKSKHLKLKDNYYKNKLYNKNKLEKLKNKYWWTVCEKNKSSEDNTYYLVRAWFATNTRRFYKKYGNKKIRKSDNFKLKGNGYRRVFDLVSKIW